MLKLCLSFIKTLLVCFSFLFLFQVTAFAGGEDTQTDRIVTNEVRTYFGWNTSDLNEMVKASELTYFTSPAFSIYEIENFQSERLKDFGSLKLSSGYLRDRITTFSKTKALVGTGTEGTVVGLYVFHYETRMDFNTISMKQYLIPTQDHLVKIGRSGLYNETVCIDYIGTNYVLIASQEPVTKEVKYRLFKVVLKQEETKVMLENMTINFFDSQKESPKLEEFVPIIMHSGF